ncbi:hypothetical protein PAHAL_1G415200 [Panicum hallii]|uniref:Transcription elongation factor SPT5 n=2 Tax=Panicum hallii TaxID=206008 RepID=A0A2S3GTN9_9POAL|nr:putative transcription elongation factor SPT5 homolog 1 [Panicum hallii]PAN08467.1 hypothetical protein PAHAL_1G415200 [Panicum hallii]
MPRRSHDEEEEEEEYDMEEEEDEDEEDDKKGRGGKRSRGGGRGKRSLGVESYIDDAASEDDDADDDDEDDDYGGGGRGRGSKRMRSSILIDDMAQVDDDDDVDDDGSDGEPDFIDDTQDDDDIRGNDVRRRPMPHPSSMMEDEEALEEYLRRLRERSGCGTTSHSDYVEEVTEVEQQALLPSVKDPKLWMVKCAIGHERETAVCLMQKFIDRSDLQIKTVVALEHLKNFIYIEAEKEAHVKEACKGLRNIIASAKIILVPIREMADVLSVESKSVDLSRDSWVRMKLGVYKGDLAKVVDVDNVRQRVTVKLIPRIDLQALANKLDGNEVAKKKSFVTPPKFFSVDEAREMHIRVDRRRNRDSGEYFDVVGSLMFKDGFLYKTFSMKSIRTQNIQPSFDELEKFKRPCDDLNEDVASLSTLFSDRKKGHFMKGDAVIVIKGDLRNLKGSVEKVEDGTVHIQPKLPGLPRTLAFSEKDLCKYFNPGDHVKVVSGVQEGATGMVVKVERHVLIILSDTTKEHIRVFADHVVESSEVTTGITRIGDYELHDLVLLNNLSFGIIIRVESEAFQILKGVPDKPELVLVKLREVKSKLDRRTSAKDRSNNIVSTKDIVRVVEGACKGKQGPVQHIHRGILFIYDRHHLEHSGFICAKSQSCLLVGGSASSHCGNAMDTADPNFRAFSYPARISQSPGRLPPRAGGRFGGRGGGGRGHDALVNRSIKIKSGPYKGYRGRVKEVTGALVRIELDSLMKIVTVKREDIGDTAAVATPFRETRYSRGVETPVHPSQTPLNPIQTPMRDPGATPIRDGMRTPMPNRAWVPMSPPRDNWEDGDPFTCASSPYYQPGTPQARPYEAPTPGSVWAGWGDASGKAQSTCATGWGGTSGNAQSTCAPSTPIVQSTTPVPAASYLPGTPGGQPMTPGDAGMDSMSPVIGGEAEGNWLLPDVLVSVSRGGDEVTDGVVKEVLPDGSCRVALGTQGNGDELIATANELEVIRPKKNEKLKIMNGSMRGVTGKLIGVDGSDGIVRVEGSLDVKIVDMVILGKVAA